MADGQYMAPKPTKACVNCRRQKMKCQVDDTPPCRRCKVLKSECIFRPRANAAAIHRTPDPAVSNALANVNYNFATSPTSTTANNNSSVLTRLDTIEALLGLRKDSDASVAVGLDADEELDTEQDESDGDFSFHGVWRALARLRALTRPVTQDERMWSRGVVKQLWRSFHLNLPLLHFLADRKAFSRPTPLLLASILYISSLHHKPAEYATLAPGYFAATCSAIADLVMPPASGLDQMSSSNVEEQVFHNILGLIMASLSSEAFIETTGTWISIGYRLLLDHCPHQVETNQDWRGLFSGLQVIDVEHASIHMCYPLVPKRPPPLPLQKLDRSQDTAYRGLAQMMHSGLSHFVGRGLPSIWSFVSGKQSYGPPSAESTFTDHDFQVIRHWAKQLDEWLVRYNGASQPSEADRHGILILLQYHLHKLFVLSIYHPARGFDLGAHDIASMEKHELLISARAILRLRDNDTGIWSNWDLVVCILAERIRSQLKFVDVDFRGVIGAAWSRRRKGSPRGHLVSLQRNQRPAPSLQHVLADRLETAVQGMHSPPSNGPEMRIPDTNLDYSWTIFDQNTLPLANPSWLLQDLMQEPKAAVPIAQPGTAYPPSLISDPQSFQTRQWIGEQNSNTWPSTLYRLFGHDDAAQAERTALG